MKKHFAFLALTLGTLNCGAQSLPAGAVMHKAQAGILDESGWTIAPSTKGRFVVKLPCLYNDFTIMDTEPGSKAKQVHIVGCARHDQKKFSVSRFQYKNAQLDAPLSFENSARQFQPPGATFSRLKIDNRPAFEVAVEEPSRCGYIRMIYAFPDNFLLIAEAPRSGCKELNEMSRQFFASLVIDAE
jgi:hypothetical protein